MDKMRLILSSSLMKKGLRVVGSCGEVVGSLESFIIWWLMLWHLEND